MENIKIQSTVYPDVQLTEDQWKAKFKVGIMVTKAKLTDKATQMMSLWDDQTMNKYYKKLKVG